MGLVPLAERGGVDLNDGGAGEGVCADEFVVGRVEDDADDTRLARAVLRAPGEVAAVEAERAELAVAAARAHQVDALRADTGVGRLAALLECPVGSDRVRTLGVCLMRLPGAIGLCIPLLAVVCSLGSRRGALVT